ncbi:MAG: RimK family alpha-L-glutamate ligase [Mycobacteriales bacterium]|nr:hypothetical protein [Frankia sp.]
MADTTHLVGLLLGAEDDWPTAFETLIRRLEPAVKQGRATHRYQTERITVEPFDLRAVPRYSLVIDRVAWWYSVPREWLKKVALMNEVYLLNNPFTFQAMEKHAAYCGLMRLGLKVPETWLVPHKQPPDNPRFAVMSARYNQPFDLVRVAEQVGYPLYMKPFDGGAWVGVSRIADDHDLLRAYDESHERLMHVQSAVEGFDVFARSLSIGAETMVMKFDPGEPMHARYSVAHDFLSPAVGTEVVSIGRLVNAFFRWEFNSCETLVKGDEVFPIDYANATPDIAITSLHYYFPWAIKALVKWAIFCTATGRKMQLDQDMRRYFKVADDPKLDYDAKLAAYRILADDYFDVDKYTEFCAKKLGNLDEVMVDYIASDEFDQLLIDTVRNTFPPHEHDHFIAHYRGLLGAWAKDQAQAPAGISK